MIKRYLGLACLLALYSVPSFSIEKIDEQQLYKEISQLQDRINDSNTTSAIDEITIASWPNTRPFGTAKTITVVGFFDTYDLYMWWEQGYLFAEAVPLNGSEAFICGPGWGFIQNIGKVVTYFDTARFEDETESSVCDDFTSPKVFVILQYDFFNDRIADFQKPFNFVSTRNPEDIVRVAGGITLDSTTSSSTEKGIIRTDLSISIPAIDLQTISGTSEIFLELQYNGSTSDGTATWILDEAGFNQ